MNGNGTRRTPKKGRFIEALAHHGNVRTACCLAGVGRSTVYTWRQEDAAFAAAWEAALDEAVEVLEEEARRRALGGDRPSDTLLIFLLKSLRPEKYCDAARQRRLERQRRQGDEDALDSSRDAEKALIAADWLETMSQQHATDSCAEVVGILRRAAHEAVGD